MGWNVTAIHRFELPGTKQLSGPLTVVVLYFFTWSADQGSRAFTVTDLIPLNVYRRALTCVLRALESWMLQFSHGYRRPRPLAVFTGVLVQLWIETSGSQGTRTAFQIRDDIHNETRLLSSPAQSPPLYRPANSITYRTIRYILAAMLQDFFVELHFYCEYKCNGSSRKFLFLFSVKWWKFHCKKSKIHTATKPRKANLFGGI